MRYIRQKREISVDENTNLLNKKTADLTVGDAIKMQVMGTILVGCVMAVTTVAVTKITGKLVSKFVKEVKETTEDTTN